MAMMKKATTICSKETSPASRYPNPVSPYRELRLHEPPANANVASAVGAAGVVVGVALASRPPRAADAPSRNPAEGADGDARSAAVVSLGETGVAVVMDAAADGPVKGCQGASRSRRPSVTSSRKVRRSSSR